MTDTKTELPTLQPPDAKSQLIGEDAEQLLMRKIGRLTETIFYS